MLGATAKPPLNNANAIHARHLIDGRLEESANTFSIIDPSTAAPFAVCPDASFDQLDRAINLRAVYFPDGGQPRSNDGVLPCVPFPT